MCDEQTMSDAITHEREVMSAFERYAPRTGRITRRAFGALAAAAGVGAWLPAGRAAAEAKEKVVSAGTLPTTATDVTITTPAGTCDAHFVHPASGRHPAVLLWPDAFGLRPAKKQMAARLAGAGYAVLVVNPYYRVGPAPLPAPGSDFGDPKTRERIMGLIASLTPEIQRADANAFIAWLDAQAAVDTSRKLGTMGYCMGGPITMRTAAERPERVGAAASFHGGRLVTKGDDSPHLLVPKMRAQYLFAIAENDDEREPEAKAVLRKAFDAAGLAAEIEVYAGAMHGWCPPDSRVYNEAQAERAWSRLLALFAKALA